MNFLKMFLLTISSYLLFIAGLIGATVLFNNKVSKLSDQSIDNDKQV